MAESEVRSDAQALNMSEFLGKGTDELLARLLAESFVKMDEQQGVGTEGFNGA
jgi:hypothetical protein